MCGVYLKRQRSDHWHAASMYCEDTVHLLLTTYGFASLRIIAAAYTHTSVGTVVKY